MLSAFGYFESVNSGPRLLDIVRRPRTALSADRSVKLNGHFFGGEAPFTGFCDRPVMNVYR